MEKEEFNKLKVQDQVEYINQKLDRKSLTEICKLIRKNIKRFLLKYLYITLNIKYGYCLKGSKNNPRDVEI